MRLPALAFAMALVSLLVGCQQVEPIVGRWSSVTKSGEVVMEFRKDGTISFDISDLTRNAQKNGVNPVTIAYLEAKYKQTTARWKRDGDHYRVEGTSPDGKQSSVSYLRITGNELVEIDATGKPAAGKKPMVRKST